MRTIMCCVTTSDLTERSLQQWMSCSKLYIGYRRHSRADRILRHRGVRRTFDTQHYYIADRFDAVGQIEIGPSILNFAETNRCYLYEILNGLKYDGFVSRDC